MRRTMLVLTLLVGAFFAIGAAPASAAVNCSPSLNSAPTGAYHTNALPVQLNCTGAVDIVQFGNQSLWYVPNLPGTAKYLGVFWNPSGGYIYTNTVPGTMGQATWGSIWFYYLPDAPIYGSSQPGRTICGDKHMSSPDYIGFRLLYRIHNPNNGGSWGSWRQWDTDNYYVNC